MGPTVISSLEVQNRNYRYETGRQDVHMVSLLNTRIVRASWFTISTPLSLHSNSIEPAIPYFTVIVPLIALIKKRHGHQQFVILQHPVQVTAVLKTFLNL